MKISTIDYYHERRKALMAAVMEQNGRNADKIRCACGKTLEEAEEIHVHHKNPDEGHPNVRGGWQHLYLLEQDVADGVGLELKCLECHEETHDRPLFEVSIDV